MVNKLSSYTIVIDTREQTPWEFLPEKKPGKYGIDGAIVAKIDAGDYTIQGLENILRIERKAGFSELFNNLSSKSERERLDRSFERMQDVKYKYMIIESSINSDVFTLSVPQFKNYGFTVKALMKYLLEIQMKYGVQIIFAGDAPAAKSIAKMIFEKVARECLQ